MTVILAWMLSHISIITTAVVALGGIIFGAFGLGNSKGKSTAETAAKVEKVEAETAAVKSIAERQTTVTTEAKNVQENVNRMPDSAVDDKLREKWRYKDPGTGGS